MLVERLAAYRLRTRLSVSGLAIAAASIIVLTGLIQSISDDVVAGLSDLGSHTIVVSPKPLIQQNVGRLPPDISFDDAAALTRVPSVDAVAPLVRATGIGNACGSTGIVNILGVTPDRVKLQQLRVLQGRFIDDLDMDENSPVAVVSEPVLEQFGCLANPGASVAVGPTVYRIVGVVRVESNPIVSLREPNVLLVPLSAFEKVTQGFHEPLSLTVRVKSGTSIATAKSQITDIVRMRHGTMGPDDNFVLLSAQELGAQERKAADLASLVAVIILSWSVLIAAIGVLNSQLTAVLERVTEIGLRRAVGATRAHIRRQFAAEGIALATLGATSGAALGIIALRLACWWLDVTLHLNYKCTVIAAGLTFILGVSATLLPSEWAARLQPSEAVRQE